MKVAAAAVLKFIGSSTKHGRIIVGSGPLMANIAQ